MAHRFTFISKVDLLDEPENDIPGIIDIIFIKYHWHKGQFRLTDDTKVEYSVDVETPEDETIFRLRFE